MSTAIKEPLPSVIELGRSLATIEAAYWALDDVTAGRDSTHAETERARILMRQEELLQEIISTLPAVTMADVAVQIGVATDLVSRLEGNQWHKDESEELERLHAIVYRITLSVLPVVAKAAGLDMAAMGWDDVVALHANRFNVVAGEGRS